MSMERGWTTVLKLPGGSFACGRMWLGVVLVFVLTTYSGGWAAGSARAVEASCSNEQVRAEQPFGLVLADCRAYEMVSPLEKSGNGASFLESRASVSGEAIAYLAPGSFAGPKSALLESRYISRRGAGSWSTRNVSPPLYTDYRSTPLFPSPFGQSLFTPDLSSGVLESRYTPLVSGEPVGYVNLYVASTEGGSLQVVTDVPPVKEYHPFEENSNDSDPLPEGASTDLGRVVFQQLASLCCGASPGRGHIYEWENGRLSLVDVAPKGAKFQEDDDVGSTAETNEPYKFGNPWRAVSADGSRVFFTAGDEKEIFGSTDLEIFGQVYVRENPTSSVEGCGVSGGACTVEVSASQRSVPDSHGPRPAFYRGASVSGSRVFFTSRAELTNDANTGSADEAANLYEFDVESGTLTDLTVGAGAENPDGAAVVGLVTASEDGSYVYFVANGVLANGAKEGNCSVKVGEGVVVGGRSCSLYVEHDGVDGWEPPRFVATLAGSDLQQFIGGAQSGNGDEADWVGYEDEDLDLGPGQHTVRVSGDGSLLAFQSELSLTGFDNEAAEVGECGETGRCQEVYLYDAVTGKLVCVSCDPGSALSPLGARPVGPAELGGHEEESGSATKTEPFYLPRNLSEGGGRLFFQSPDALVPHDSNGRLDVYEWEFPGVGSCTSGSPSFSVGGGGCVFPISDVAGSGESRFMDASPDGNDVFIWTADQLVPSDTDSRADVYDVRVGGGFPVSVPPPVCVNADSCKPPVSPQPGVFGAPASATFSGAGNIQVVAPVVKPKAKPKPKPKSRACKRGFTTKRGKCVKSKPRKSGRGRLVVVRAGGR